MEVASEEIASSSSSLMVVEALDRGSLEAKIVNKRIALDKKLMAAREGRRNGENAVKTERLPSVLLNTEVEAPFGRLPPEISRLPLVVLNVSNNSFSGPIPTELGDAHCLQNLDLSINNFSSELPASLNGLTDLTKFNVRLLQPPPLRRRPCNRPDRHLRQRLLPRRPQHLNIVPRREIISGGRRHDLWPPEGVAEEGGVVRLRPPHLLVRRRPRLLPPLPSGPIAGGASGPAGDIRT